MAILKQTIHENIAKKTEVKIHTTFINAYKNDK